MDDFFSEETVSLESPPPGGVAAADLAAGMDLLTSGHDLRRAGTDLSSMSASLALQKSRASAAAAAANIQMRNGSITVIFWHMSFHWPGKLIWLS